MKKNTVAAACAMVLFAGLASIGCGVRFRADDADPARVLTGEEGQVARWLREYEEAWNLGDAKKIGRMLTLDAAEMMTLRRMFEERKELRVTINDVKVQKIQQGILRATYVRLDRWLDNETNQGRSSSAAYEQTFGITDGRVRSISLRRR